jgi:excinuclease ABC subunit C
VSFKNGRPDRANYRRFKIKTVEGQDDFASMAEVVKRRYSRSLRESKPLPDLILIDGGKGQLGMACAELQKLGLEKISVIGLAKEFEEIYLPGESKPLRLGLNHPAVKLLQRIRDECHRVANSYNAQLRIKRISESVLDDFPGIGERRKAALLKKFGSVQRLKTATLEQIAAIPGFGGKAAAALKTFLAARN